MSLSRDEATKQTAATFGAMSDYRLLTIIEEFDYIKEFNELEESYAFIYEWLCKEIVERNIADILIHNGAAWSPYMTGKLTPEEINALPTFLDSARIIVREKQIKLQEAEGSE